MTETLTGATVDPQLLAEISAQAGALDRGEQPSRRSFTALGAAGLLGLGAPGNADGRLPEMAEVIGRVAGVCMSTAFSVWANRMVIEYLSTAATPYAAAAVEPLRAGTSLGVTAMASAFKDAAGCGSLDLTGTPVDGGFEVSGQIRWASNLYPDSTMVTAVRTDAGQKLIVALPLDTAGVAVGDHFKLLALDSTASSYLKLDGVRVPRDQVLAEDFPGFVRAVRPTFLVLQTAICLGLARTCVEQGRLGLVGVNEVFAAEHDEIAGQLGSAETALAAAAAAVGGAAPPSREELLSLRLRAAELSTASAALEIRTAGGKGYASGTPASRRYREAAFIPVQSPSEAQLRWELGGDRG